MFSQFFINRPVFSAVLSIVILIAGFAGLKGLPIEQYPEVLPPQVQVSTSYPGASAEVISSTVSAPLEQQINGVDDMLYMTSTASSSGTLNLSVYFKVGTDPDMATINVNNRVQAAINQLPSEVQRQGVRVAKRSSNFLKIITLVSPDNSRSTLFMSNYALINILDDFKRIPGVGDAMVFGSQDYSIRIWIDPGKLAKYNLTTSDVIAKVREQNSQFSAGRLGQEPVGKNQMFTYTVTTKGRLVNPDEFGDIIIRSNPDGSSLRLKSVASVELGSQSYNFSATQDGKPVIPMAIFLQSGANALEVSEAVDATMQKLKERFPSGVDYTVPYDSTKFVKVSIDEVKKTLIEAMLLVVLVVFIFLQKWRATLIPILAIPVSIIGTFAGMYALGYSINLLTLFGLVLAIGIVVDDAIIVIENVERNMQKGLSPKDAAILSMKEVTSALVAIVLVLCAVFIPVAFTSGMTGVMYQQFAITIVISVVISGIVALTLTPSLCATLLKEHEEQPYLVFRKFNQFFAWATEGYGNLVKGVIKLGLVSALIFGGLIYISYDLFKRIPTSLVPQEDQGYLFAFNFLPPASSLSRTSEMRDKMQDALLKDPDVDTVTSFAGFDMMTFSEKTNSGVSFILLKDWSERKNPDQQAEAKVGKFMGMFMQIPDGMAFPVVPPPIRGLSITGGFEMYIQDRSGGDLKNLNGLIQQIVQKANAHPILMQVRTTLDASVPQYNIVVDREKVQALNVSLDELFTALSTTLGSYYVNDFNMYGRNYKVNIQAKSEHRENPQDLSTIFVKSQDGKMVPISSLVSLERTIGADIVQRFNQFTAAQITGAPKPGYSSGDAIKAIEEVCKEVLPPGYTIAWSGSSYQEKELESSGMSAFYFGIILVFLILAAQYERWLMPLAVVSAVPFAVFGSALAVFLSGIANDIYFQIGLIVLIGLSAKNAILIVEFAMQEREKGLNIYDSAIEAAKLRLRPIIMTSIAFTAGVLPLIFSSGAGAASRLSIGTGVIGGMLAATFIATLFIPLFYIWVARLSERGAKDAH